MMLYRPESDSTSITCLLCQHYCHLKERKTGMCGVNKNEDGQLKNLVFAHPTALHLDPIEKKPLFHFLPGSKSFSIGTVGCNFRCSFCQNWQISQNHTIDTRINYPPQSIVELAEHNHAASIAYTYNEPTIFWPYAREISALAKTKGLKNVFVTNGLESAEVVEDMKWLIDAANVDLKSFDADYYEKKLKGSLEGVCATMKRMKAAGIWVEVTTLLIEGLNDSDEELQAMAAFIAGELGVETPWHLTAFHPDYKMLEWASTSLKALERARIIGKEAGLYYVYLGNVPDEHSTYCPSCGAKVIERSGFGVGKIAMNGAQCAACGHTIAGVFA